MHNEVAIKFLRGGKYSRSLRIQKHCAATKIGITFEPEGVFYFESITTTLSCVPPLINTNDQMFNLVPIRLLN